jgi:hypothetical protein
MLLAGPLARARDVGRFRTEALAVAQLGHPNVVQIGFAPFWRLKTF